jgi:hypothetical protein
MLKCGAPFILIATVALLAYFGALGLFAKAQTDAMEKMTPY